ncbi:hypothetical protein BH23CHL2_BH23CHL2_20420 [soil metagenome]
MHRFAILPLILAISLIPNPFSLIPSRASAGTTHEWTANGDQYVPRTDGRYIVWLDGRGRANNTSSHFEIWGADMTSGEEFLISEGDHDRLYPDVDQGVAVWTEKDTGCNNCQGDIVGKRLGASSGPGETFVISAESWNETRPAITNTTVVWVGIDNGIETLWMKDIFRDEDPVEIATAEPGWVIDLPRADDNKVVWSEYQQTGTSEARFSLHAYDILTGRYYDIAEGETHDVRGLRDDYDVDGNIISWAENHRQLYIYDMTTGTSRLLLTGGGCPTIEGGFIFYEDFRYFDEERRIEVWGYELATGANFHVGGAPGENHEYANVNNGIITWQQDTGGSGHDIIATSVTNVLPTRPEQRTGDDSESYRYFDETMHPLTSEFLSFWDGSGGLPVFGYPLTSEYEELNPDLGEPLRVQYLERQRFEHHPDLAGTPYEVLIGRLGFTAAERAGLLDTEPFQPVDFVDAPDGCLLFSETGHTLCGRFLDYWQSSGLEFGDEDVTYRESLALFGLPLSEEFTDPVTGYVSQYFERAIFEYHPENDGTEFEVLLRRLGVEELQARNWCSATTPGCDPAPAAQRGVSPRLR